VTLCASRVQNGVVATVCLVTASDARFTEANKLKSVLVQHMSEFPCIQGERGTEHSMCPTSRYIESQTCWVWNFYESAEPDICLEPLRDGVYVPGVKRALEGCAVVLVLRRKSGAGILVFFCIVLYHDQHKRVNQYTNVRLVRGAHIAQWE